MKKILVINPFGIGDVLFTTPVVSALKSEWPDSSICYWCNERVKDLLRGNPAITEIFGLSRGDIKRISDQSRLRGVQAFLRLAKNLKKEKFDIAFDFSLDHRYSLVCKLLGVRQRIGFDYKRRGRFLTEKMMLEGYSGKHVVEFYLDLLKKIHVQPRRKNLELFVSSEDRQRCRDILAPYEVSAHDTLIGMAVGAGASWGKDAGLKHWMPERFAELGDRLLSHYTCRIILLGDGSERHIADTVGSAMAHPVIDLVGKTSIREVMGIMSQLGCLITNDGGPLHMAVALNINTVSIFGPVDEKVYGPYPPSSKHIVVTSDSSCRPCYSNFRMAPCRRQRQCIQTIGVDRVYASVQALLQ